MKSVARIIECEDAQAARIMQYDAGDDHWRVISRPDAPSRAVTLVRHTWRTLAVVQTIEALDADPTLPCEVADAARPARGWDSPGPLPSATVIVCTLGSSPILRETVKALLFQVSTRDTVAELDYDVVVVDNAPSSGKTLETLAGIDDSRLRIISQPLRGLSRARNAGVAAATGAVVAFTDDDAVPDQGWLSSLLEVFSSPASSSVGAVTGLVMPAELIYPSQRWFEEYGGFSKGTEPVVWSSCPTDPSSSLLGKSGEGGPLFPMTTARVGAGANMAFRQTVLTEMGPFDCSLGAGTPSEGGEDLDAFARVLQAGHWIIYSPDAAVWHTHRRTLEELKRQIRGNGTGMAAVLTKSVLNRPTAIVSLLRRCISIAARVGPGSKRNAMRSGDFPHVLTRAEIGGFCLGPLRYVEARYRSASSRNKFQHAR